MEFHNSLRAEQLDAYSFFFTKDIKIRKRSGVVHQSTRWQCKKYNFDTGRNYSFEFVKINNLNLLIYR